MNYDVYKSARDASWKFLIDHNVNRLPVDLHPIIESMGIKIKLDTDDVLNGEERGKVIKTDKSVYIIVPDVPIPQKRYTIMHEIGHIVLGHTDSVNGSDSEEYAAERFAIGVLAPACVLWGLKIHYAEDIAKICNISITAAKIREKRMAELYARNKFLTSTLERQVYNQFIDFINYS